MEEAFAELGRRCVNGGASQLLAERRQTWQVTYYTRAGQPDTPA